MPTVLLAVGTAGMAFARIAGAFCERADETSARCIYYRN